MSKITLSWEEYGEKYSQIINLNDPYHKKPGVVRIGRDPNLCDIILKCPRVSRLHAEIYLAPQDKDFKIKNLRETNPILVDGQKLIRGSLYLSDRATLILGEVKIEFCKFSDSTTINNNLENSITFSQFLPLASSEDLRQKGYLLPGILTVIWVVLLFANAGDPGNDTFFNFLIALFLGGGGFSFIYQLCGKKKPFWILFLPIILTPILLYSPVWAAIAIVFREILPGQIPGKNDNFITVFIAYFFGAGLAEELLKALPILFLNWLSKMLSYPKLEVKEPLDGILLGAASGLGFTLLETLGQYVPNLIQTQGALSGLQVLIPRIVGSVFGHMAYSGCLGYYIGLASLKPKQRWQLLGMGYLIASVIHALWNTSVILGGWALALSGITAYCLLTGAIIKARQISPNRKDNFATQYFKD
ncbi:MAG: PrsW family glutamic-type intramembrane protease [Prochloraceae cyanobacterium]